MDLLVYFLTQAFNTHLRRNVHISPLWVEKRGIPKAGSNLGKGMKSLVLGQDDFTDC